MLVCDTTNKRLLAVSGFYFAEGIPDGFVYTTLAAVLAERGASLESIGQILALATLPWTFKFVWGFIIDRFRLGTSGSRRPWIIIGQFGVTAACISLLWLEDGGDITHALCWIVLAQSIFAAIQDTAVDAMAVEMLPDSEKGRANGFMKASSIAGLVVGGVWMSWLITHYSWRTALLVQATLMLAGCLFTWAVIEPPKLILQREKQTSVSWFRLIRLFVAAFKGVTPLLAALIGVVTAFGGALFATGCSVFFIQKLGWSRDALVALSGGWSYLIGLFAALAAGYISDRGGHRRVAIGAAIATVAVIVSFPILRSHWSNAWLMGMLFMLQSVTTSVLGVSLFAIYMDISWKEVAASQFCGYMAMLNLGGAIGEKLIGTFVTHLDWAMTFMTIGGVYALTAVLLAFVSVSKQQATAH